MKTGINAAARGGRQRLELPWLHPLGLGLCLTLSSFACTKTLPPPVEPTAEARQEAPVEEARIKPHPRLPPRSYTDGMGTALEFVPVKIEGVSGAVAIVRLTGVDEPIDSLPVVATRKTLSNGSSEWRIMRDGIHAILVEVSKDDAAANRVRLKLAHPRGRVTVAHDPISSASIDAKDIIRDYNRVRENGVLERFENIDRQGRIESGQAALNEVSRRIEAQCGSSIPVDLVWESLPDEELGRQYYCQSVLESIAAICKQNENVKSDLVGAVKRVSCSDYPKQPFLQLTERGVLQVSRAHAKRTGARTRVKDLAAFVALKETVLKSSSGLYVTINANSRGFPKLHAGWAPNLYAQRLTGAAGTRHFEIWHGATSVTLKRVKGREWQAHCPGGPLAFREVNPEDRDQLLDTAEYKKQKWNRVPMALARDRMGNYYYVDRLHRDGFGHRLYRGRRGAAKLVPLLDVVTDPGSVIFMMKGARLQVRFGGLNDIKDVTLSKGRRSEKLQLLTLLNTENIKLIYNDLGVYDDKDLGGICDVLQSGPR